MKKVAVPLIMLCFFSCSKEETFENKVSSKKTLEVSKMSYLEEKELYDAIEAAIQGDIGDPWKILEKFNIFLGNEMKDYEDFVRTRIFRGEYIEYKSDRWFDLMDRYRELSNMSKRLTELSDFQSNKREYIFGFGSEPSTTIKKYKKKEVILSVIPFFSEEDFKDEHIRTQILGITAHELRHMYQFHKGELTEDLSSYDIEDEIEAYSDQDIITFGEDFFKYKFKRTAQELRNLKENGIYLYEHLPNRY